VGEASPEKDFSNEISSGIELHIVPQLRSPISPASFLHVGTELLA